MHAERYVPSEAWQLNIASASLKARGMNVDKARDHQAMLRCFPSIIASGSGIFAMNRLLAVAFGILALISAGFQYFSLVQEDFGGQLSATGVYQRFREGPDLRTSDR